MFSAQTVFVHAKISHRLKTLKNTHLTENRFTLHNLETIAGEVIFLQAQTQHQQSKSIKHLQNYKHTAIKITTFLPSFLILFFLFIFEAGQNNEQHFANKRFLADSWDGTTAISVADDHPQPRQVTDGQSTYPQTWRIVNVSLDMEDSQRVLRHGRQSTWTQTWRLINLALHMEDSQRVLRHGGQSTCPQTWRIVNVP